MSTRDQIVDTLEEIALLLELKGENPFKIRAYRTGAEVVQSYPGDIVQKAADNDLKGIKGIGSALQEKLQELASTGALEFHKNLRAEFPESIFELFDIQGLGPKKIKAMYEQLGVKGLADLQRVCENGEAAQLSGFGKKSVEKILLAIAFREQNADRFHQDVAMASAELVRSALLSHPAASRVEAAGSLRRGKETLHDLDFIVATKKPQEIMDHFVALPIATSVISHGSTKSSIRLENGLQCDLRAVSNAELPFALNYFTGSKEHNVAMRGRALKRGYTLNEYRLAPTGDNADISSGIHEEADLYRALGLEYIDPSLRENTGEIEAAENGGLPKLIELENLRGTFHNHTIASDGKNTLAEMAAAAQELGLEYLGIADHSKASFQANGLDEGRLRDQIAEIAALNASFDGFKLFTGTECDILKDGSLDFDDDLLADLDYVVASVHNVFNLPEKEMTARLIRAIENPNVTMLGHLTGRLLLKREPYALNVPAILDAAAETGTIIELNANPWRLDMDWRWWKLAKEKSVKCAINPDAHNTDGLQCLAFGVRIARKGWLTRADVINCLPLAKVTDVLNAKRSRGTR
ncbi:MAG: DNA polymerase (family 10) [Verrucomicrobiales bacterium]|jgi:DNA polymerase (family 10)